MEVPKGTTGQLLQEYLNSAEGFLDRTTTMHGNPSCYLSETERVLRALEESKLRAVDGDWELAWSLAQGALRKNKQEPGIGGVSLLAAQAWESVLRLVLLCRGQCGPETEPQELDRLHRYVVERLDRLEEELPMGEPFWLRLQATTLEWFDSSERLARCVRFPFVLVAFSLCALPTA